MKNFKKTEKKLFKKKILKKKKKLNQTIFKMKYER